MTDRILIGKPEPDWEGMAYVKGEQKKLSKKDFGGKWHILYWYPLDFPFVCPTEIKGFQENLSSFLDDKIDVIGVSTDSFFSHKAWFADRKTFPQEITHPVLADLNHSISRAFGVLKEEAGIAYRASVVLDDKGRDPRLSRQRHAGRPQPQGSPAHRAGAPERRPLKGDKFVA
jgi:alkyl hydroperoxide reductase subunit AhpC